jgi:hypothetical protein
MEEKMLFFLPLYSICTTVDLRSKVGFVSTMEEKMLFFLPLYSTCTTVDPRSKVGCVSTMEEKMLFFLPLYSTCTTFAATIINQKEKDEKIVPIIDSACGADVCRSFGTGGILV